MTNRISAGILLVFFLLVALSFPSSAATNNGVIILCYHDVGIIRSEYSTSRDTLEAHFAYLRDNGFSPISLDQYIAACKGTATLPDKPVLLSFDDGYLSFYTDIFPLLKKYNYPAMMAIVTSWPEGYTQASWGPILNWSQIREMDKSGLVEFASHSHDSHRYFVVNPAGDSGIMLEDRQYRNGKYETLEEFKQRVQDDLHQSQQAFITHIGHPVKAVVWPFGGYNQIGVEIGQQEGFEAFFGLEGGFNLSVMASLTDARRGIITNNMSLGNFAKYLKAAGKDPVTMNAAQLDLDMIYDPKDPKQTERNLEQAINRLLNAQVDTVYLQAFCDTSGTGNIDSVYFHTDQAPVKADLFSHVVNQLQANELQVYAWMPTLACQWLLKNHPEDAIVAVPAKELGWYKRATPFSPRVHQELSALIADLMSYSNVNGILFQDDMYMNDYEDYSPSGKEAFRAATGVELTPSALQDPQLKAKWIQLKTDALTNLTMELIQTAKRNRPYLLTARNMYPTIVTQPDSQEWFAQNYKDYLAHYDFTILMAYPYMEKEYEHPIVWLENLATSALIDKTNASKVVFKLQAYDWNKNRWLSASELRQQHDALKAKGAIYFAYYPENVFDE